MIYTLDSNYAPPLTLQPETPQDEMLQNLYCLMNTYIAEVPCYRNFGMDLRYISAPMNLAKTMFVSAIAEALNEFFPALRLEHVDFNFDSDYPDKIACRIEVTDNNEES